MFKIGDVVKVVTESWSWGPIKPGDVGVVVRIEHKLDALYVSFPNHPSWAGKSKDFIYANSIKHKKKRHM